MSGIRAFLQATSPSTNITVLLLLHNYTIFHKPAFVLGFLLSSLLLLKLLLSGATPAHILLLAPCPNLSRPFLALALAFESLYISPISFTFFNIGNGGTAITTLHHRILVDLPTVLAERIGLAIILRISFNKVFKLLLSNTRKQ